MTQQLKVSDLFKKIGVFFTYESRNADQQKLIERMKEFPVLKDYVKELDEYGVASLNFLEYFLAKVTKTCSQSGIDII